MVTNENNLSTAANIGLLPIAAVEEGEMILVCLQLSCISCSDIDSWFSLNVSLHINSVTAGTYIHNS